MVRAVVLALALTCSAPVAANAAGPFLPPVDVAQSGGWPDVEMRPDGSAVLAWTNSPETASPTGTAAGGVWVAERPPAGAPPPAAERIYDQLSVSTDVATNDRGDVAVVWDVVHPDRRVISESGDAAMRLRFRPAGGAWGPVETVPMPPLQPADRHPQFDTPRRLTTAEPHVAIAPDGTATVSWLENDAAADTSRAIAVVRRAGGAYGPAHAVGRAGDLAPRLAVDGTGRAVLTWRGFDPGPVLVAERAPGDDAFGAPATLAPSSGGRPQVVVSARGDALVTWSGTAASRAPGGPWAGQALGTRSTAAPALTASGDGAAAWAGEPGGIARRPAGGAFGSPLAVPELAQAGGGPIAAGFDARGTLSVLWNTKTPGVTAGETITDRTLLRAAVLPRGAAAPTVVDVSSGGRTAVTRWSFRTDAHGNGIAVWEEASTIRSALYSADPPTVTALRATPRRGLFRFLLSEPAAVALTILRAGRRVARVEQMAAAGANRIELSKALTRRLRRRGRYTAVLDVSDLGRPLAAAGSVRFRVR